MKVSKCLCRKDVIRQSRFDYQFETVFFCDTDCIQLVLGGKSAESM